MGREGADNLNKVHAKQPRAKCLAQRREKKTIRSYVEPNLDFKSVYAGVCELNGSDGDYMRAYRGRLEAAKYLRARVRNANSHQ